MKKKLYPLADYHPERKTAVSGVVQGSIMAVNSGIKRPPKKGEWYLSGAIVAAYKAPNDLSTPYVIANLVRVKEVKTVYELERV